MEDGDLDDDEEDESLRSNTLLKKELLRGGSLQDRSGKSMV